jgi:MFS family permease
MPTTTAATPLRSSRLRRIVAAYTINRLGTWFGFIALSVAVFDHTHSTIAVAGLLLAGQVLPAFLVPALVARVETSARRGELGALYFFEAAATAALAGLLLWHIWLPAILLLVALDGTAALAAGALLRAAAARAAREWAEDERDRLGERDDDEGVGVAFEASAIEAERRANAALNIGFAVTFTLGPVLGGIVVTTLGAPVALLIDTVSFIACGTMLLDLKPHVEDAETSTVAGRVKAAWRYITQTTTLRRLLIAESVALVFFEFSPPIEVAYAKLSLHAGANGYGILLGVWGLGVALGSVFFARSIKRSLKVMLSGSTLAVGLAYLGWATAPSLAVASFAGLIGGVGNGVQWAALISAVQRITPQALQGRLMGAVESLGAIFPAFGFALSSGIVALSSPRTAFLVAGIGASLSTFAFLGLHLGTHEGEHAAEPVGSSGEAGEPASQDVPVGANAGDAGFAGAQPTPGG